MTQTTAPSRRRALLPLATLLAAASIAMATGASFNASTANPGNAYETGTLAMTNSRNGADIFDLRNLKPGDTVSGSVTVTNSGSLPAVFTVTETGTNGFTVPSKLTLTIREGDAVVATGTLAELGTVPLGTWAAGQARTFTFTAALAADAGNVEQGKTAATTYTWNSVQTARGDFVNPTVEYGANAQ